MPEPYIAPESMRFLRLNDADSFCRNLLGRGFRRVRVPNLYKLQRGEFSTSMGKGRHEGVYEVHFRPHEVEAA